jgi:hypothetical protein
METFSVEGGGKKNKIPFFGVTTTDGDFIGSVMVTLADGVTVSEVWHNNPVPEPTTLLLLGSCLMALVGLGRKKLFKKL